MENQNNEYNSFHLVQFIWRWKTPLIIICVLAAVLSFTFSTKTFIRPKFKSTAIIYAPRTNSVAKILLNEQNYNERLDIKAYAVEEETEQMMQILNSREIQDALIKKYDLINYYEIDPNKKYWQTKLYKALLGNIKIKRTEYGAISITVQDWDPVMAANMANEIVALLDSAKNKVEGERARVAYEILVQQCAEIEKEVKRVNDSLSVIMSYGVFDFKGQSERLMQQHAIAVAQGNTAAINRLSKEIEKLAKWGPTVESLQDLQYYFAEYQSMCKAKMMDAKVDMESVMPTKFIVENAIPADKKDYPKKLLIMITSTLAAFIVSLLVLIIMNNIKNTPIKKEEE